MRTPGNQYSTFVDQFGFDLFLGVGSDSQGVQTAKAIIEIESYLLKNTPDLVMVVGDTNAGVSGALAACKLGIPVVHTFHGFQYKLLPVLNKLFYLLLSLHHLPKP